MPECIVCKANYVPGEACPRCESDNSAWEEWKREERELGTPRALLYFLAPYLGLPLMIAGWALAFGLLGMLWPWGGVRPSVLVLVVALTFVGCILAALDVHGKRFALRERELLRQVKRGRKKGIGIGVQTLLAPAIALSLAVLLTLLMIRNKMVWETLEWLVLEPQPSAAIVEETSVPEGTPSKDATAVEETAVQQEETPNGGTTTVEETPAPESSQEEPSPQEQEELPTKEKVKRAFPLICLSGYVTLAAFAYSSSLMLAQEYARQLDEFLPLPIFLREDLLTNVVRREAERIVCRPITPRVIGGEEAPDRTEQRPRSWTWDEMERTDDGGIRLKALVRMSNKVETSLTGERIESPVYVTYEVEANPWSRITRVARVKKPEA